MTLRTCQRHQTTPNKHGVDVRQCRSDDGGATNDRKMLKDVVIFLGDSRGC